MEKVAKFLGWDFGPPPDSQKKKKNRSADDKFLKEFSRYPTPEEFMSKSRMAPKRSKKPVRRWGIRLPEHDNPMTSNEPEIPQEEEEEKQIDHIIANKRDLEAAFERYEAENELMPDYRYADYVDKELKENDYFEEKPDATPEEVEENKNLWNEIRNNKFFKFLYKSEKLADEEVRQEIAANSRPYRPEDEKLWRALPPVPGPFGTSRPMPRKAINNPDEAIDKFWDFFKERMFGIWGLQQRYYPPEKPMDVAQVLGYDFLDRRFYDLIMRHGCVWYYKDRLGRTRGPMEIPQLQTAWGAGVIDKHTFVWGEEMDEWAPISMVYGLQRVITVPEVKLAAAVTATVYKLYSGIAPWTPLKGHEKKTHKQLYEEAIASKERERALLRANGGVWPGESIPSHALFLWASGTELTSILEESHTSSLFVTPEMRHQLTKLVPNLRPWEIQNLEDALLTMTFRHGWWRYKTPKFHQDPTYYEFAYKTIEEHADKLSMQAIDFLEDLSVIYPEEYKKLEENSKKYREMTFSKEPWD